MRKLFIAFIVSFLFWSCDTEMDLSGSVEGSETEYKVTITDDLPEIYDSSGIRIIEGNDYNLIIEILEVDKDEEFYISGNEYIFNIHSDSSSFKSLNSDGYHTFEVDYYITNFCGKWMIDGDLLGCYIKTYYYACACGASGGTSSVHSLNH